MAQLSEIHLPPPPGPPGSDWRLTLDSVGQGLCVVSAEETIIFANRALCQMTGFDPSLIIGTDVTTLFALSQPLATSLHDLTRGPPELPLDAKDIRLLRSLHGQEHRVRLSAAPFQPTPDYPAATLLTLVDITALSTRLGRLEGILNASDLATWEWNVQTGEVIFNAQWAAMLGYTLCELSPLSVDTWVSLVHPDDLARANRSLARHFAGENDAYQCDCRLRHKNGEWLWINTRGRVVSRTPEGNPALVYGTHQDITQTKRMMQSLQDSENSYELVALATPSALYDWDIATDAITWRGKSYEVLGAPGNLDLPTRSVEFQNWVHPEDWARYRRTLSRYFRRETQVLRDDLRLLRPDGTLIWVEYHGAALWEDNRARRMFGSFTDISRAKRDNLLVKRATSDVADALPLIDMQPDRAKAILKALAQGLKPPF